jgi:hypothetical protein
MGYFIYTNWKAKDKKVNKIHIGTCGHCKYGQGKRDDADCGENGVWIGPFNEIVQAEDFANQKLSDKKVEKCKVCLK